MTLPVCFEISSEPGKEIYGTLYVGDRRLVSGWWRTEDPKEAEQIALALYSEQIKAIQEGEI